MTTDAATKLERILAMSERLAQAIDGDIAALESARPGEMKTIEPETQRLSVLYERELSGLSAHDASSMPGELRARCASAGKRLSECLLRQQRLLKRMRHISEGMIRSVAEELARQQSSLQPYSRRPNMVPRRQGAMIYNSVV